jgi:hypothetical protein
LRAADLLQIRHSGESWNLTKGNAEPGNQANWTPCSAFPSVTFAGVTNISALPLAIAIQNLALFQWSQNPAKYSRRKQPV